MKNILRSAFFICIVLSLSKDISAQSTFEKLYGGTSSENAQSVWATSDGGYILGGSTYSFGTGAPAQGNFYMVKTDLNGVQQWQKFYGFAGNDIGGKAFELPGGGYVMAGSAVNPGTGGYDIYVIKTDAAGTQIWANFYDGGISSTDVCYDAIPLSGGGIMIAGASDTTGTNFDAFLLKINAAGTAVWKKHYGTIYAEVANAVKRTADNGLIFCGYSNPTGFGVYDMYVVKTDSSGNTQWQHDYGGAYSDFGEDIIQLADGSYTLVGNIHNYVDSSQAFMIHLNAVGTQQWIKNIGRTIGDEVYSVAKIAGGYVCNGYTQSSALQGEVLLMKTNNGGDTVYTKLYGSANDDVGSSIVAQANAYLLAGTTVGFGNSNGQMYLIKADTLGNIPCPAAAIFTTLPTSICEDNLVTFVNTTVSSVPFIWKINGVTFANGINAFHQFDTAGNYQIDLNCCSTQHLDTIIVNAKPATNFSFTNNGTAVSFTMASGLNPQTFSWNFGDGTANNTTQQNPSHTYANLGSYWITLSVTNTSGCDSTFISQIHLIPGGIDELNSAIAITVFPNPVTDELNITFLKEGKYNVKMFNGIGVEVFANENATSNLQLATSNLSSGFYFLSIENNAGQKVMKKVMVQH